MKPFTAFRDWARGYADKDIDSAVRKLEDHWTLPAGHLIPLSGPEMLAVKGEGLMGIFMEVRSLEFINHPLKRRDAAGERS